jgi:hypothetical protein
MRWRVALCVGLLLVTLLSFYLKPLDIYYRFGDNCAGFNTRLEWLGCK